MPIVPFRPEGFTKWFKIVVREGDLTLGQFLSLIKERYGLTVNMVESDLATQMGVGKPLYNYRGNLDKKLTELAMEKFGTAVPVVTPEKNFMKLLLVAENADGEDVEMPQVAYYWK